jgi:branched-chain amino acid transport system substrate-binding protein
MTARRVFTVIAISVSILFGCVKPAEDVKIGVIAMLQGENAENGAEMKNAATLAVKEVNDRGGLHLGDSRRRVVFILQDDAENPDAAIEAARSLIYKEKVEALIGP